MLRETDFDKQRALMRQYETRVIDTEAREFPMLWWNRMIPERSYVHGWKIGPSHFINQDLSNIWLDEGPMDDATTGRPGRKQAPPVLTKRRIG